MRTAGRSLSALVVLLALAACDERSARHEKPAPAQPAPPPPLQDAAAPLPPMLQAMLQDRPAMRSELMKRPELLAWISDRFTGTTGAGPIDWSSTTPQSGQPAEHVGPAIAGEHLTLRISGQYGANEQLGFVVFELINMERDRAFADLNQRAYARTISRDEYAEKMTRHEHAALVKFKTVSKELGIIPGRDDLMLQRMLEAPEDFAAFEAKVKQYLDDQGGGHDPRRYWAQAYDAMLPPAPQ